jgi:hypothetical protein
MSATADLLHDRLQAKMPHRCEILWSAGNDTLVEL